MFATICPNKEINTSQTQINTKDFTNDQNHPNVTVKLKFCHNHFCEKHTQGKTNLRKGFTIAERKLTQKGNLCKIPVARSTSMTEYLSKHIDCI